MPESALNFLGDWASCDCIVEEKQKNGTRDSLSFSVCRV